MPYHIKPVKGGYKVEVHGKYLSKRPLSLANATAQRQAVAISEAMRKKKLFSK